MEGTAYPIDDRPRSTMFHASETWPSVTKTNTQRMQLLQRKTEPRSDKPEDVGQSKVKGATGKV